MPQISLRRAPSNNPYSQMAYWFFTAALAGVFALVLHEFTHFLIAKSFGASDVIFHWAFVEHDATSVSSVANALIALTGPLSTYLMVVTAWWFSRKTNSTFLLALGFTAAFRNLLVLPYLIRTILGRDTSTFFFDEIRGANAIGISPLFFVLLSFIVFIIGAIYFSRKAKREKGIVLMIVMIIGTFAGVYAWSVFGSMLFPGGHGFN